MRRNAALADRVKKWVDGEDLLQTSSTLNANRRSWRDPYLSIQFFSRLGSFTRRVPSSASTATLYRLAFRGMKGRHSQFDLHSNGMVLGSSTSSGLPSSLKTGSIIHINIHENMLPTPPTSQGIAPQAEFEDICLVKVYSYSRDEVLFSYWTSKNTTASLASLYFRHWRYLTEKGWTSRPYDVVVWTDLEYVGDGGFAGSLKDHWEGLSKFLTVANAKGCLLEEDVYGKLPETTDLEDDSDLDSSPKPLVLRVYLRKYNPKRLQKRAKKATNLSRVSRFLSLH